MKSLILYLSILLPTLCFSQIKSEKIQIEESIRVLPDSMRENATVIGYNQQGERIVIKNGTNDMIVWADNPILNGIRGAYFVVGFPKSLEAYMNRSRELVANGLTMEEAFAKVALEIKEGIIKMPAVSVRYTLRGHAVEGALPLTIIHIPFLTQQETGFSEKIDNYRPWLMLSGTAHAHIMVPGH